MIRLLAFAWAGPGSLVGLALCLMARAGGGPARRHAGTLEACGGWLGRFMARTGGPGRSLRAVTFGHVILARDEASLEEFREHERVHVRQWERWGPLFPFAYLAASLWAWLRGRDPYRGNRFEREAWGDREPRPRRGRPRRMSNRRRPNLR
ncbi:MAG: signal peptide prediction [Candidatus Eisenbacteria bacterium]|nr:signal peptide prediction [Candidatus Eisenbacteria bacterium]